MTPHNIAQLIRDLARTLGLDRVGFTSAGPLERGAYYKAWLAAGHGGTMAYLHRNTDLRDDPRRLLPGARSVICFALSYHRPPETAPDHGRPLGRIARYARGRNYHFVLYRRIKELLTSVRERLPEPFGARICVDTAPVFERELAQRSGIGWIGKNTNLLHPHLGSYFFLGEAITTLDLPPDPPATDHCGTCARCLDACPTRAFIAPHQLDASRCISYLTIEHQGEIAEPLQQLMGDWVYGCDVCQEVCPFNTHAAVSCDPQIRADHTPATVDLLALLRLRSGDHRRLTRGSASTRASRATWRRNAAIALGNTTCADPAVREEIRGALAAASRDQDAGVRDAARVSLGRLSDATPPHTLRA